MSQSEFCIYVGTFRAKWRASRSMPCGFDFFLDFIVCHGPSLYRHSPPLSWSRFLILRPCRPAARALNSTPRRRTDHSRFSLCFSFTRKRLGSITFPLFFLRLSSTQEHGQSDIQLALIDDYSRAVPTHFPIPPPLIRTLSTVIQKTLTLSLFPFYAALNKKFSAYSLKSRDSILTPALPYSRLLRLATERFFFFSRPHFFFPPL